MSNIIKNIIYSKKDVEVATLKYEDTESLGIFYTLDKVIILPYTLTNDGIIEMIGVIKEFNPTRETNNSESLIIGTESDEDDSELDIAIRTLNEKTGYNVIDETRWSNLKTLYISDIINLDYCCYAVDITSLKSFNNNNNEFYLQPLSYISKTKDSLILAMVMKLYLQKFGKTFNNNL